MTYSLLVFDWDGTLMDSAADIVYCFQTATGELGWPVPSEAEVHNIIGLGMKEAVAALFPDLENSEAQVPELIERYRHHYFHPEKQQPKLFDGAKELILDLESQGYFLAVATGKGRRGLDAVLQKTGLDSVFHTTICVDEAHSKPHPQMLEEVMDRLGGQREQTLMIGDSEYDLLMAKNAGVDSAAVLCGAHDEDRLMAHQPVVCKPYTRDLGPWLAELKNNLS
jgi:phosphoglycolate phosphatase